MIPKKKEQAATTKKEILRDKLELLELYLENMRVIQKNTDEITTRLQENDEIRELLSELGTELDELEQYIAPITRFREKARIEESNKKWLHTRT